MVITRKIAASDIAAAQHILNQFSVYLLFFGVKFLYVYGLWEMPDRDSNLRRVMARRYQLDRTLIAYKSKNPHLVTRYTSQYFSIPLCPLSDTSVDLSSRFLLSTIQIFVPCSVEIYSKKDVLVDVILT